MVNRNLKSALGVVALAALGVGCGSDPASPGNSTGGSTSSAGTSSTGTSGAGGGAGAPGGAGMTGSAGTSASAGTSSSAGSGGQAAGGSSGAGGGAGASGAAGASGSGGGGAVSTEKFSFFVTSMKSLLALAKAKDPKANEGFGGVDNVHFRSFIVQ